MAQILAQRLLTPNLFQTTSRDGLFITGIRRIGKTTFLQQDFVPELQRQGALVIYVDLWGQAGVPPYKAVLGAVQKTFTALTGTSSLKEIKISLACVSLSFEPKKIGLPDGVSLSDAVLELIDKIHTNIVLVLDEIQQTLKSEAGRELLMALKAARDAVNLRPNNTAGTYFLIVGTGSHRSVVTAMTSRASQPFYGADRVDFPVLGEEFVDWRLAQCADKTRQPTKEALLKGFHLLGCRPKAFLQILGTIQDYPGQEIDEAFLAICDNQARLDAEEFLLPLKSENRLVRILFTEIARAGEKGCKNLFGVDFKKRLKEETEETKDISSSLIQAKIAKLQKLDLIFPVAYGSYAVSDPQAARIWLRQLGDDLFVESY